MIPGEYFLMMMGGALIALVLPAAAALCWRKYSLNVPAAFFGVLAYVAMVLLLEPLIRSKVLSPVFAQNLAIYILAAALCAAVLEESSKFFSYLILQQTFRGPGVGISVGLGFGGCASVVLCLQLIAQIRDCNTVNTAAAELPPAEAEAFLQSILQVEPIYFLLSSVDRLPEIILQTAFALIVWYAFAHGRPLWLAGAVLLRVAAELPQGVMQIQGVNNLLLAEIVVFGTAFAALALAWSLCRPDLLKAQKERSPKIKFEIE
ncbi:MAG: YhfC family intramembrane metalloprotease [Gracilibacteraceae bacterium]|nr:YhfC family intramembrane metalloprotease [Gracilibacteraceae bacterium]